MVPKTTQIQVNILRPASHGVGLVRHTNGAHEAQRELDDASRAIAVHRGLHGHPGQRRVQLHERLRRHKGGAEAAFAAAIHFQHPDGQSHVGRRPRRVAAAVQPRNEIQ